jgi:hypothetical protein
MNIQDKLKTVLRLAEVAFQLPNDETTKILALVEARKVLHGKAYFAGQNEKTGATKAAAQEALRTNAADIKGWLNEPVTKGEEL